MACFGYFLSSAVKLKLTDLRVMLGKKPLTTRCMESDSIVVRNFSSKSFFEPRP